MKPKLMRKVASALLSAVSATGWTSGAVADGYNWIGPDGLGSSGNWSAAANWSPAAVPGHPDGLDDATISPSGTNNVTVSYDYEPGIPVTISSLSVDLPNAAAGNTATLSIGNNLPESYMLNCGNSFIGGSGHGTAGDTGTGTIAQSGGEFSLMGSLYLGYASGSTGVYNLGGDLSYLNVNLLELVGSAGTGAFTQTSGANVANAMAIGAFAGASGSYNLSGGGLTVAMSQYSALYVGGGGDWLTYSHSDGPGGSGTLTVSGTGHLLTYLLEAYNTPGTSINLNGGTIETKGLNLNFVPSLLHWTSGTLQIDNSPTWDPGNFGDATSNPFGPSLTLNSGQTLIINGQETLGGTGGSQHDFTLTVNGDGTHTVTGTLAIDPGSQLNLSGGIIDTAGLDLNGTPALLNWTSGTLNITTDVTWDAAASSTSTSTAFGSSVTLNNKTLEVTGGETLGTSSGGSHLFTLTVASGGSNTVSGTLTVNSGSQLNLSGGTITANVLNLGNTPSRLNWSSGTLHLTSDISFDPGNTPNLFGGFLDLGNNKTFAITGNETVGGNSFFYIEADSGGAHTVSGTLMVNPEGELIAGGGSITAGTLNNIGMLTVGSGMISGNSVTLNSGGDVDFYLANTTRGTGYGVLSATGNLSIAGELHVYLNGLTPAAGQRFDLLDWSTHSGKFNFISLPSLSSGLSWSTLQLYSTGVLEVVSSSYLPGDFNRDGHVNAADITAMEQALTNLPVYESSKGLTAAQLVAIGDLNGDGVISNADLQALLNTLRSGGGSADPVPEPASWVLAFLALVIVSGTHFSVRCVR